MRRNLIIASLALAALSVAGCSPSNSTVTSSASACGHWSNIRSDVRAGILTDSELRDKVAQVRSSATSSNVESAATELLAAITSGSKSQMTTAYSALNSACS